MTRALALVSGGLDSILAAKLIKNEGIEVIGICFKSAFFEESSAIKMAEQIDIELKVVDFTDEHLDMVKNPKHGYGKNMNPCIDCHSMMMKYAGRLMEELKADFIVTGEVLNQRPMSQNRSALDIVKKESGFQEYILRPLCAKNLKPTKMELEGLVNRENLLDISGRTRKAQMELAEKWGIVEYPSPAGGCMLTEPNYSARLRDCLKYNNSVNAEELEMLRYGRHFRINDRVKIISTRTAEEAKLIKPIMKQDYIIFDTLKHHGSTIILQGEPTEEDKLLAARICVRYSKGRDEDCVPVKYKRIRDNNYNIIETNAISDSEISKYLI